MARWPGWCPKLDRLHGHSFERLSLSALLFVIAGRYPMSNSPKHRILVVDDQESVRATVSMLLAAHGYLVTMAEDGFEALLRMKSKVPDLIVSDLNMPRMSGFELLSVVRRRFPQVLVVAMSGAYEAGDMIPGGVIADAFYPKGNVGDPEALVKLVAHLLRGPASQVEAHTKQSAPV